MFCFPDGTYYYLGKTYHCNKRGIRQNVLFWKKAKAIAHTHGYFYVYFIVHRLFTLFDASWHITVEHF